MDWSEKNRGSIKDEKLGSMDVLAERKRKTRPVTGYTAALMDCRNRSGLLSGFHHLNESLGLDIDQAPRWEKGRKEIWQASNPRLLPWSHAWKLGKEEQKRLCDI